jgi:hypothetical protein
MKRLFLGFRALFRCIVDGEFAERLSGLFADAEEEVTALPTPGATRSDAVTLLAVLQREARFVDFVQESIDAYPDAQVGAAVRQVHKGCRAVLDRALALEPTLAESENAEVTVPAGADPNRYRMVGNVTGEPPVSGTLAHHGWQATRCELPEWRGSENSVLVVAPAEVELR